MFDKGNEKNFTNLFKKLREEDIEIQKTLTNQLSESQKIGVSNIDYNEMSHRTLYDFIYDLSGKPKQSIVILPIILLLLSIKLNNSSDSKNKMLVDILSSLANIYDCPPTNEQNQTMQSSQTIQDTEMSDTSGPTLEDTPDFDDEDTNIKDANIISQVMSGNESNVMIVDSLDNTEIINNKNIDMDMDLQEEKQTHSAPRLTLFQKIKSIGKKIKTSVIQSVRKTRNIIKKRIYKRKDTGEELSRDVLIMLKIQTKLIDMIGIGMKEVCNDIRNKTLNWYTFEKILGKEKLLFKLIRKIKTRNIKHLIIQYIAPYTAFLPISFTSFIVDDLYGKENDKNRLHRIKFIEMYNFYEEGLYQIYKNKDYIEYSKPMFPPNIVLNNINIMTN
jgi:hypothetical protein